MRIENDSIAPVSRSGDPRRAKRDNRGAKAAADAVTGTALVPLPQAHPSARRSEAPHMSSRTLVTAQVLAQKLPHTSDSRIARRFPATAIGAYRQCALRLENAASTSIGRSV